MNTPQPADIRSIFGGKVDTLKLYVNGKEYPVNETCDVKYGIFATDTGVVTYFNGNLRGEE